MHKLSVEGITKSKAKLPVLQIRLKNHYIVGRTYELSWKIMNIGNSDFPGGIVRIDWSWPIPQIVLHTFPLNALKPNEVHVQTYGETHVLAAGFALYNISVEATDKDVVQVCDARGNPLQEIDGRAHFFSLLGEQAEELYEFWMLIFAVVGLWIAALGLILQLIN